MLAKLSTRIKQRRGKSNSTLQIVSVNLLPKKERRFPQAAVAVPILGAALIFVSVTASFFFDTELSINNVLGAAASFGELTATIYDSPPFTCVDGAANTVVSFGSVVIDKQGDLLMVDVSLSGATNNASYDIWVNQDPGGCPLAQPTAAGALLTDGSGDGNAHVETALVGGATNFWISAVGGGQVLRSVAVSF